MNKLTVADVMTVTARPAMPLKELARVLAEHHVSALRCSTRTTGSSGSSPSGTSSASWAIRHPGGPAGGSAAAREEVRRATGDTVGTVMTAGAVTIGPRPGWPRRLGA